MLTDNFYKNVLNIIAEDASKLRNSFAHSVIHTDFNPSTQGKAALADYFSVYLGAIKQWCEQNETSSSFSSTTFLPESNPSIMGILNPGAVGLENTDEQVDGE